MSFSSHSESGKTVPYDISVLQTFLGELGGRKYMVSYGFEFSSVEYCVGH